LSITDQIQRDVVAAMKAGEKDRLSALRMVLSQLQLSRKEGGEDFGEEQEVSVLIGEKKRRLQAAEAFRSGGAEDRAAKEEKEAALIDTYLPAPLSQEELESIVDEAIAEVGAGSPKDMGKVMPKVMGRVSGRADGGAISALVRKRLGA
jgi:hypothetical protein